MKYIKPEIVRDDETLWEASYENAGTGMSALLSPRVHRFFFREVMPNPRRTWWTWWRPRFVRTGTTWSGNDMRAAGFRVLNVESDRAAMFSRRTKARMNRPRLFFICYRQKREWGWPRLRALRYSWALWGPKR